MVRACSACQMVNMCIRVASLLPFGVVRSVAHVLQKIQDTGFIKSERLCTSRAFFVKLRTALRTLWPSKPLTFQH